MSEYLHQINWHTFWHTLGIAVFAVFILAGFITWISEMLVAWFSKDHIVTIVMEKPEFADTEPIRAVVRRTGRPAPLVRVAPYVGVEDRERTDVIALEATTALEKWAIPLPPATYTSHNGWDEARDGT